MKVIAQLFSLMSQGRAPNLISDLNDMFLNTANGQKLARTVKRILRGSTGCRCLSATGAGSPDN
jgi:hypothetical protein